MKIPGILALTVLAVMATDSRSTCAAGGRAIDEESQKRLLKGELVPHTLMIETALKTSKDEISGIRSQLVSNSMRANSKSVQNLKSFESEIRADLRTITTHEAELKSAALKYPRVAASREYQEAGAALEEVKGVIQRWDQKAQSSSYWNDRRTVLNDLAQIESRIDAAMDKTRNFSSSQLDYSSPVG